MTKAELVENVADRLGITKKLSASAVDAVFETIKDALVKGDKVQLIPFGSFSVRKRKAREGRNPKTGAKIKIAAKSVPVFSAGKGLKDSVA